MDILKAKNKPVWLFACLKMDEFIDKWSLIISAPWINESNKDAEFEGILNVVKQTLNSEQLSLIARIVLLDKDDHLIQELLKKNSGDEIREEKVNGNIIHSGFIVEANPNLTWTENRTLL